MRNHPLFIFVTVVAFAFSLLLSCKKQERGDDYLREKAKTTEVWIWDRVEHRTDWETVVYISEEEFKEYRNHFWGGNAMSASVIPYTFIFYENGYYDTCDRPSTWHSYLKNFKDGDGPGPGAQFWKIEGSYFYTTHTSFKAKRDSELGKNYKIISNDSNTIVLQPIDDSYTYPDSPLPGSWGEWTVTLKKKKYGDFHYNETVWW